MASIPEIHDSPGESLAVDREKRLGGIALHRLDRLVERKPGRAVAGDRIDERNGLGHRQARALLRLPAGQNVPRDRAPRLDEQHLVAARQVFEHCVTRTRMMLTIEDQPRHANKGQQLRKGVELVDARAAAQLADGSGHVRAVDIVPEAGPVGKGRGRAPLVDVLTPRPGRRAEIGRADLRIPAHCRQHVIDDLLQVQPGGEDAAIVADLAGGEVFAPHRCPEMLGRPDRRCFQPGNQQQLELRSGIRQELGPDVELDRAVMGEATLAAGSVQDRLDPLLGPGVAGHHPSPFY